MLRLLCTGVRYLRAERTYLRAKAAWPGTAVGRKQRQETDGAEQNWTNYHLPSVFHAGEQPEHRGQNGALERVRRPPCSCRPSRDRLLPISQFAQLDPNHLAVSAPSLIIFLPLTVAVMCIVPLICSWSTAMISPVPESFAPISRYSLWPWYWSAPASSRCPQL